jgi:hypothetical protein
MELLPELRGMTSLTHGAARNVKSLKQKKVFLNELMNSELFLSFCFFIRTYTHTGR